MSQRDLAKEKPVQHPTSNHLAWLAWFTGQPATPHQIVDKISREKTSEHGAKVGRQK